MTSLSPRLQKWKDTTSELKDRVADTIQNYIEQDVAEEYRDDPEVWKADLANELWLVITEGLMDTPHYSGCEADFEYGIGQISPCRCDERRETLRWTL
ncbi:hypothetical protein SEA_ZOOMAN_43 [Microbacterium phage Zooman]|nr:hypothetical protein SEA_ZOOMAN_43 [Microbacterium phage Zooman]